MHNFLRLFILFVTLFPLSAFPQTLTSTNLPILIINTKGQAILDEPKIVATLSIIDNGTGKRNNVSDSPSFESKIGIEKRGATSQQLFPKKPYGFELRDTSGVNSVNASLLGMPAESDWVLNATYNDKTLIREALTYDLNRQMSAYYTPRYRYCEVILNGNYEGIYLLFEKIKRNKNRVNITSIKQTDVSGDALTGGYIFKIDKTEGSPSRSWNSPYRSLNGQLIPIQIERPKPEDLAEEQFQYAKKYITDFENALKGTQYQDSTTGYRKYINADSFVDYLLLTEVCKNVDGYRLSSFFYKDRDSKGGKLLMGPIWDYNLTYGNANYCEGNTDQGWAYNFNTVCKTDTYQIPFWWDRLLSDKSFATQTRLKYQTLRKTVLKTERIQAYVDSVAAQLTEARTRNFQRWPVIGVYVWPNGFVGQTYQQEIDYLKTWVKNRLDWMDNAILLFGADVLAVEPTHDFKLTVNPNPSTGPIHVNYQLQQRADVWLTLTDATGRTIYTITRPGQPAGEHWETIPNYVLSTKLGVYFLQLTSDGQTTSKKLLQN
ncbi:CotH kinase family protein [Spirosoma fluviale]|uniref:Por secretion system C-terminal sorting domain-containing protein n=1 Tax=Spirosoma fluviale TaxID=1597977 RepID=A0A286GDN9_9BACT|nr:CotH kinase family protein [Spirosoma fluviale]SOD93620.1 Por secretion system C-terminal sorting domain-containing protein [Spirosoma fluviale]